MCSMLLVAARPLHISIQSQLPHYLIHVHHVHHHAHHLHCAVCIESVQDSIVNKSTITMSHQERILPTFG